ncbi:MAG: DUF1761 domain-containing protein [Bacteroidota bacterium]
MDKLKINHLAVWVAAIIVQVLPPLWYAEIFLGIRWAELNNLTAEDFESFNVVAGLGLALFSGVAIAYLMAYVFAKMRIESAYEGFKVASLFWLCSIFLEIATQNAFTLRSFELTLIDSGVVFVKYEIIGITLGAWRKYDTSMEAGNR